MVSKGQLLGVLPAYQGNYKLIVKDQQVPDIMKEVVQSHQLFASDYDRICDFFDAGNLASTAKRLYDFCKRNISYKVEPEEKQTTKNPAAILALGHGDCKHYALFIAGVLDALKRKGQDIDWWYRFASYNPFKRTPGHVFVVVMAGGSEVWIDPVLPTFNNRKQFAYKQDKRVPMSLYRVSGFEDDSLGKIKIKVPKIDVAKGLKKAGNAIAKGAKATAKVVKKVAASPARNAFLALVAFNVHGFATSLQKADQSKLKSTWEKLGGNYTKLKNTIDKGAKKKRIAGIDDQVVMEGVGVIQLGAALAAAAPVIAALSKLLKATGNDKAAEAVDTTVEALNEEVLKSGTPVHVPKDLTKWEKAAKLIDTGTAVVKKVKKNRSTPAVQNLPVIDPTPAPASSADDAEDSADTPDLAEQVKKTYEAPKPAAPPEAPKNAADPEAPKKPAAPDPAKAMGIPTWGLWAGGAALAYFLFKKSRH